MKLEHVIQHLSSQLAQAHVDLAVARAERDEAREALDAIPATEEEA